MACMDGKNEYLFICLSQLDCPTTNPKTPMDLRVKALVDDVQGHTDQGHTDTGHTDQGHTDQGHTDKGHTDQGHTDKGHAEKVDPETVTNAVKLIRSMVKDMDYIIRLKNKGWQKIDHRQRLHIVGAVDDIIVSMGFSPICPHLDISDTTPERFKAHLEEVIEMVNTRYPYSRKCVCTVRFLLPVDKKLTSLAGHPNSL